MNNLKVWVKLYLFVINKNSIYIVISHQKDNIFNLSLISQLREI